MIQSLTEMFRSLADLARWSNDNSGLLSILIFVATLLIAWSGGLFRFLRQKPRLSLSLLVGPNFACTYQTGQKFGEYDVNRTFFSLYLNVVNRGSAAATVENAQLAYKWSINKLNWYFLRYVIGWCWLPYPAFALTDFQFTLKSGGAKFYPFLFQRSTILPNSGDSFLPVGKSIHGMIYFEQQDAWGGCQPLAIAGKTPVKIRIVDSFGKRHTRRFKLPIVTLEEARKWNPSIGTTRDEA